MPASLQHLTPDMLLARWGHVVQKGTLANWRCQGRGPMFIKAGAKVLYPVEHLLKWEAKNLCAMNDNEPR